jgi:hypothetical protein
VHLRSVKSLRIDAFLARLLHQITLIPVAVDRVRTDQLSVLRRRDNRSL